ncbi:MAG: hypothetical protein R2911_02640 [Caldilineaceae bacterium]
MAPKAGTPSVYGYAGPLFNQPLASPCKRCKCLRRRSKYFADRGIVSAFSQAVQHWMNRLPTYRSLAGKCWMWGQLSSSI